MKLLAIPLFELYDDAARYGPQLSAIPHLLSRFVVASLPTHCSLIAIVVIISFTNEGFYVVVPTSPANCSRRKFHGHSLGLDVLKP